MGLRYRSFASGSGGNAALIWTPAGGVLVDLGLSSQKANREVVAAARKLCPKLDTVLVTHAHGDHINAGALKVMRAEGLGAYAHPETARQVRQKYGEEFAPLVHGFALSHTAGGFTAEQLAVSHAPGYHTSAFVLHAALPGGRTAKACFFTDLMRFTEAHVEKARGADFIFVEANHDAELLRRHGHPGSEFHLPNRLAGEFIGLVCEAARPQPAAVVLGHLSRDCNRPELPPVEVEEALARRALRRRFGLYVAGRCEPGPEVQVEIK